jgi:hypothetical protein
MGGLQMITGDWDASTSRTQHTAYTQKLTSMPLAPRCNSMRISTWTL